MSKYLEKLDDEIRFRIPKSLKKRLIVVAKARRKHFSDICRDQIYEIVDEADKSKSKAA